MSLLRRRMMMGAKQSDFPLVEVENISIWTASVTDDAREVGFTLEKPYHLCLSRLWSSALAHLLTDADFLCMDVPDNSDTIMTDRNLYIPAIGYYSIGAIGQSETQNITAASVVNGSHNMSYNNIQPPYKVVVDSRNRRWIRVPIDGLQLDNVHHKCVSARSSDMPIYYCVAENLGEMFPSRVWDKKYLKIDLFIDSERTIRLNSSLYTGLNYDGNRNVFLTHEQNGAPAYYNGTLEGYLPEIPTSADHLRFLLDSSVGGAWVGLFYENLAYSSYGWANTNDRTITNTAGTRFVSITSNTTNDIKATLYAIEEW